MERRIILYGDLRDRFGKEHVYDVETPAEALKALQTNYKDFRTAIDRNGKYCIKVDNLELTEQELAMQFRSGDIHIIPITAGNKSSFFKILFGVVLIAAAIFLVPVVGPALGMSATATSNLAWSIGMMGVKSIMGGIAQMMAPSADPVGGTQAVSQMPAAQGYTQQERPEERPSYLFNGPVNTTEQGGVIPVVYGTFWRGSITVSAGVETIG